MLPRALRHRIRNAEAFAIDAAGQESSRHAAWPGPAALELAPAWTNQDQEATLPAEELLLLK